MLVTLLHSYKIEDMYVLCVSTFSVSSADTILVLCSVSFKVNFRNQQITFCAE